MASKIRLRITLTWPAAIALLIAAEASAGYSITDLGSSAPGSACVGNAINATGGVAGTLKTGLTTVAVGSTGGGGLGPVSFSSIPHVGSSTATGINDVGQVTGSFFNTADRLTHAYRTVDGAAVDLGTLDYHAAGNVTITALQTLSNGINSSGQVAGTASLVDGTSHAFRGSSSGGLSFLTAIGDGQFSQGNGINAGGQVVGSFEATTGVNHAFYTDTSGNPVDILTHYSTPGFGLSTYGTAINAAGAMAGSGDFGLNSSHAFLAPAFDPAKGPGKVPLIDLGVLNGFSSSVALGINATSQVVGKLSLMGTNSTAFVYDQGAGMIDLRSLLLAADQAHWTSLTLATAINDNLQITGQGVVDGQLHAFLMTPIPGESPFASPATVPAPPALVLSGLGCAIAAAFAWLQRVRPAPRALPPSEI